MKRALCLLGLLIFSGCSIVKPQVWYQPGKTPAEAYHDLTTCKTQARTALDPHGMSGFMPAFSKPDVNGYVRDCMKAKGWFPTSAKTITGDYPPL